MASDKQSLLICMTWLASLVNLCASTTAERAPTKAKMATMSMALCEHFPSGAFTFASAQFCARGSDFFPAFDSLTKRLDEWWQSHRPHHVDAPDQPGAENLPQIDLLWLRFWNERHVARAAASDRMREANPGIDEHQLPLARLASMVRQYSPAAWAVIAGPPRGRAMATEEDIARMGIAAALTAMAGLKP